MKRPSSTEFLALSPSWLAMAWLVSKAQWFWNHRPDLQFGWVVLLLCAYLIFDQWERRPCLRLRWSFWTIGSGLVGLAMVFVVQIYQAAFGTMAASVAGLSIGALLIVTANLGFVYGFKGLRHFGFGFAFILIALPLPSALYNPIVHGLQSHVAAINVEVLNLIGIPASQTGSLIHLPNGTVGIDEACSGIRSLQSTIMATLFIGYLTLKRFGLQAVLFGFGLGFAIVGNLVRSFFLSYVAYRGGLQAIDRFHDTAGWSVLAFTALGVALAAWMLNRLDALGQLQKPAVPPESDLEPSSSPHD